MCVCTSHKDEWYHDLRLFISFENGCFLLRTQQEEEYNFIVQSELLDDELHAALQKRKASSSAKMDDKTTKTLYQMRGANRVLYLAGSKKDTKARKGDAALNKQYYDIRF